MNKLRDYDGGTRLERAEPGMQYAWQGEANRQWGKILQNVGTQ